MRTLGVLEARTDFSAIVTEVENTGQAVTITKHGRPVVRIVPAMAQARLTRAQRRTLIEETLAMRDAQPETEPFDIREALGRDRGDEWS